VGRCALVVPLAWYLLAVPAVLFNYVL